MHDSCFTFRRGENSMQKSWLCVSSVFSNFSVVAGVVYNSSCKCAFNMCPGAASGVFCRKMKTIFGVLFVFFATCAFACTTSQYTFNAALYFAPSPAPAGFGTFTGGTNFPTGNQTRTYFAWWVAVVCLVAVDRICVRVYPTASAWM